MDGYGGRQNLWLGGWVWSSAEGIRYCPLHVHSGTGFALGTATKLLCEVAWGGVGWRGVGCGVVVWESRKEPAAGYETFNRADAHVSQ